MSAVPEFVVQGRFVVSGLSNTLSIISLAMSMTVNACSRDVVNRIQDLQGVVFRGSKTLPPLRTWTRTLCAPS